MLLINYITWHYTTALREILVLAQNFLEATWHKFFIGRHFATLFAPWHRLRAKYMFKHENFGDRVANLLVDVYVRFLAAGIRLSIIFIGIFAEAVVAVGFALFLAAWILWPFIFISIVSRGVSLLIT